MKKIPTVLVRDRKTHCVTEEITPGCEWVLEGEGVPTRKYDGTCVMYDGSWWSRRLVSKRPVPADFRLEEIDPETNKMFGWIPIEQSSFVKPFNEAAAAENYLFSAPFGTYELCGPKINGNPEKFLGHTLIRHAEAEQFNTPHPRLTVDELIWLILQVHVKRDWEGLVWHHPDGRLAKLKAKDIG